jgi:hypothetical protein
MDGHTFGWDQWSDGVLRSDVKPLDQLVQFVSGSSLPAREILQVEICAALDRRAGRAFLRWMSNFGSALGAEPTVDAPSGQSPTSMRASMAPAIRR